MKILVYGAGVIGSIYAVKLYEARLDVTLLARGKRYNSLNQSGIIIKDVLSGKQIISTQQLSKEFPGKKIILGFPGAGGTYNNDQIDYIQIKEQKTTIGDIDGNISSLTKNIKKLLEKAGFKVAINSNMQAWLKIHAIFITCVTAAIMKENGDSVQLGKNKSSVRLMVKSINEGFKACRQLGMPIAPANLKTIFMIMPQWFSVWYWQKAMQGKTATLAMAPHANTAKEEMQLLAKKVLDIVHSSSVATPTLNSLLSTFIRAK